MEINGHTQTPEEQYALGVMAENRKIERKMISAQILAAMYTEGTPDPDCREDWAHEAVAAADALLSVLDDD